MIVRELLTRLGFEIDDSKLKTFTKSVDDAKVEVINLENNVNSLKSSLKTTLLSIGAIGFTLSRFALTVAQDVSSLKQLAESSKIGIGSLQELENAAVSTGIASKDLTNSISTFNKQVGIAKLSSTGSSRELIALGINLRDINGKYKDTYSLYTEVAQKINNLTDENKKAAISQKLLGTTSLDLLNFVGQGSEALRKQREEVAKFSYIIDSKGVAASENFIASWQQFKIITNSIKTELSIRLMPVFTELLSSFKEWYIVNRKTISLGFDKVVTSLSYSFNLLVSAIKLLFAPIAFFIASTGGMENAIDVLVIMINLALIPVIAKLSATFLAFGRVLLTNPLFLVGTAIALLIQDFINFKNGNESLLGDILKSWFSFEGTFNDIVTNVKNKINSVLSAVGLAKKELSEIDKQKKEEIKKQPVKVYNISKGDEKYNIIDKKQPLLYQKNEDGVYSAVKPQTAIASKSNNEITTNVINNSKPQLSPLLKPQASNFNKSYNNVTNTITQNISENVTVNVPTGTTQEQVYSINEQIRQQIQDQFNFNISRAFDSMKGAA